MLFFIITNITTFADTFVTPLAACYYTLRFFAILFTDAADYDSGHIPFLILYFRLRYDEIRHMPFRYDDAFRHDAFAFDYYAMPLIRYFALIIAMMLIDAAAAAAHAILLPLFSLISYFAMLSSP